MPEVRSRRSLVRAAAMVVLALGVMPASGLAQLRPDAAVLREFFDAVAANQHSTVRKWILRGLSPDTVDPEHGPALVLAARERAFDAFKALLESPLTDVNPRNPAGETALMYLAMHGELGLARTLIARGAQVNMPGWTPLHYAATAGHIPMIDLLLEQHAYIDAASENGTTPLMLAARAGQLAAGRHLVKMGADPSLRNQAGLGAPEYLMRAGEQAEARWMAEQASQYLQRYGTREAPVPAGGAARARP